MEHKYKDSLIVLEIYSSDKKISRQHVEAEQMKATATTKNVSSGKGKEVFMLS